MTIENTVSNHKKMFVYNNRIYRQHGNSIIEFVDPTPDKKQSEFVYNRHICDLSHARDLSYTVANNMLFVVFKMLEYDRRFCEIFDLSKERECLKGVLTLPAMRYVFGENIHVHDNVLIVDETFNSEYDCSVYDVQTLKKLSSIPRTKDIQGHSMLFHHYLFLCTETNLHMQLHMYDLLTGELLKCIPLGSSGSPLSFPFKLIEKDGFIYFFCFRFIVRVNIVSEEVIRKSFPPLSGAGSDDRSYIEDCHVYHDDVLYVMSRDKHNRRSMYSGCLREIFSSASDTVPFLKYRYCFFIRAEDPVEVNYYRNVMVIACHSFILEGRLDIKSLDTKHHYIDLWFEYDSYYRSAEETDEHGFNKIIRFNMDNYPGTWATQDIWNSFDMSKPLDSDPNYDALKRSCYKRNNFSRLEKLASYIRCPRAHDQLISDALRLQEKKRVDVNVRVLKALITSDSPEEMCRDIYVFDSPRRDTIGSNDLLLRIIASFLN